VNYSSRGTAEAAGALMIELTTNQKGLKKREGVTEIIDSLLQVRKMILSSERALNFSACNQKGRKEGTRTCPIVGPFSSSK